MRGIEPNYNKFSPQPKQEKVEKSYKGINKVSEKTKARNEAKRLASKSNEAFYKQWFDEHKTHKCYESGESIFYFDMKNLHHIIAKRFQDRYSIDIITNPDNLVLLSLMVHSKAETNIDHAPKVKKLTEETLKKFEKYLI